MGLIKSDLYPAHQNEVSAYAKAMAHPARIAILDHLFKIDSCVCGDLVNEIGLAQPTISQHLQELKKLQLIKGTIEGTKVCYCINVKQWQKMKDCLNKFLNQNPSEQECC